MGSYTTTLRRLMDPQANTAGYTFTKGHYDNGEWVPAQIIKTGVETHFELWDTGDKQYPLIFDDPDWEGYDPTYRSKLNSMITDYYWGYEIGSETPAMFKHRINTKMRQIMPYYNLLFKAEWENFKDFDPNTFYREKEYLGGTDKTFGERKQYDHSGSATYGDGDNKAVRNKGKQYNFDTPQNIASLNPDSPDHMSSAAVVSNENGQVFTQNGFYGTNGYDGTVPTFKEDTVTDNETFKNRKDIEKGYNTSRYTQYKEYLEGLRNIDEMIIDELRDCFMLVY